jgi:hypothetical protein
MFRKNHNTHTHSACCVLVFSSSSWVEEEANGQQWTPNSSKPVGPWGGNQIRREKENKKGGNIPLHPQCCCCSRLSIYTRALILFNQFMISN